MKLSQLHIIRIQQADKTKESQEKHGDVIPAKAGIQFYTSPLDSRLRGNDEQKRLSFVRNQEII